MAMAMRGQQHFSFSRPPRRVLVIGEAELRARVPMREGMNAHDWEELESVLSPLFEAVLSKGPYEEIHYFAVSRGEIEEALAWLVAACGKDGVLFLNWRSGSWAASNGLTEAAVASLLKENRLKLLSREQAAGWNTVQLAPG